MVLPLALISSYLESRNTVGRKTLIPQFYITRNFGTNLCQELRCRCRVRLDRGGREVVSKHLARACQRKWRRLDSCRAEDLEGFGVGCVREKGGAKRVEDASEWCDQPRSRACAGCVTLTVRRNMLDIYHQLLPVYRRSWP